MYLHIRVSARKPDFQGLWMLYRHLVNALRAVNVIAWGHTPGSLALIPRGWIIAVWFCTSGRTSICVLGQKLDPSLVECQCMAEEADVFHPIDCPREHLFFACNPDGRDSIPITLIAYIVP